MARPAKSPLFVTLILFASLGLATFVLLGCAPSPSAKPEAQRPNCRCGAICKCKIKCYCQPGIECFCGAEGQDCWKKHPAASGTCRCTKVKGSCECKSPCECAKTKDGLPSCCGGCKKK